MSVKVKAHGDATFVEKPHINVNMKNKLPRNALKEMSVFA